jgi:thiol:disulfide interchange protein
MRWLNALGLFFGFAMFAIAVFCSWRFVTQTDLRTMQLWGAGAALAFLGLGLIKLWFWFELKANVIVREIKRVELQVSSLAAALHSRESR